ncbi:MAG: response regulator transcription factor [Chloroflexi bacterium]|nr:response regulator transcription factor [Chloroflexota bacterium]
MATQKVLLIDDDSALLTLLGQYLERAGYEVVHAENGAEGIRLLRDEMPGIVVLDIMMPRMDGWETCARLRKFSDVPVIMLSAKGEEADKLKGFRLGVDDYVTKPFSFAELAARIGAILQRGARSAEQAGHQRYTFDNLVVDVDEHLVMRDGRPIDLTPTEFRLLCCLVENAGHVLSRELLLERVWGPEYNDAIGYIRRYIWYLRQKIEEDPANPRLILTEREFGYRFARAEEREI